MHASSPSERPEGSPHHAVLDLATCMATSPKTSQVQKHSRDSGGGVLRYPIPKWLLNLNRWGEWFFTACVLHGSLSLSLLQARRHIYLLSSSSVNAGNPTEMATARAQSTALLEEVSFLNLPNSRISRPSRNSSCSQFGVFKSAIEVATNAAVASS